MTYEIILTDLCTRDCKFCFVKKHSYVESASSIQVFIDHIKKRQSKNSSFNINLFGGEPLLNISGVQQIIEAFDSWPDCQLNLYTNGDLLLDSMQKINVSQLNIQLTAYDIFTDQTLYKKIISSTHSKSLCFAYTFDESNVNDAIKFKQICRDLDIQCKVTFSHSRESWKNMSVDQLESIIRRFYSSELTDLYESPCFDVSPSIARPFKQAIQLLFDDTKPVENCLNSSKQVFYHGEFIGSCIMQAQHKDVQSLCVPVRCRECEFLKICLRRCPYEYINSDIDEKLCMIQKAGFIEIFKFFKYHLNEERFKAMLIHFRDDMNQCV